MKNIRRKIKKVFTLATALALLAGNSLCFAKNSKPLEEILYESNPKSTEFRLKDSEISTKLTATYEIPNGIYLSLQNRKMTLEKNLNAGRDNPKFTYRIGDDDFNFDTEAGKEIDGVIQFWSEDIKHPVSLNELEKIAEEVAKGSLKPKDIQLFENSPVTVGDAVEMLEKVNEYSKITCGKDSFNYAINLPGNAEVDDLTIATQNFTDEKGSKFQFLHGVDFKFKIFAGAHLNLNAAWPDSVSLGEFAEGNFPDYANQISLLPNEVKDFKLKRLTLDLDAGYDYSGGISISQFARFKKEDGPEIGFMQVDSKIKERHARFFAGLDANPATASATGTYGKEESKIEGKSRTGLVYGIANWNFFSFLAGFREDWTNEKIHEETEKTVASLSMEGFDYKTTAAKTDRKIDKTESKLILGISGAKKIFASPFIKTDFSVYGLASDYPKDKVAAGGIVNSRFVNAMAGTGGDYEAFLTLFGNKRNPFNQYFREKINLRLNPLKEEIEDITERELSRSASGLFLRVNKYGRTRKAGILIASPEDSYLEGGIINGDGISGFYANMGLGRFGISALYKKNKNENSHGEKGNLGISYNFRDWAVNLDLETKEEEPTKIHEAEILFSKAF